MEPDAPIVLPAGDGERLGTIVVKVARPELSLLEIEIKPGGGVQPHFHKEHSAMSADTWRAIDIRSRGSRSRENP